MSYYIDTELVTNVIEKANKRKSHDKEIINNKSVKDYNDLLSKYNELQNKYNDLFEKYNNNLNILINLPQQNSQQNIPLPPPLPNQNQEINILNNVQDCVNLFRTLGLDPNNTQSIQIWLRDNIGTANYYKVLKCATSQARNLGPKGNNMNDQCVQLLRNYNIDPNKFLDAIVWLGNEDNKRLSNYNEVKNCLQNKGNKAPIKTDNNTISQQCRELYNRYQLNPNDSMAVQRWLILNRKNTDFKKINQCQSDAMGIQNMPNLNQLRNKYETLLNNTKQLLTYIQINGISEFFDCGKNNFGVDINQSYLVLGSDVDKITLILSNPQQVKIALKLWFSRANNFDTNPKIPKELYVYNLLKSDNQYISKFRHMEILLGAGICHNSINYVKNILDVKCNEPDNQSRNVCKANIKNNINSSLYNPAVKYGASRFAEVGSVFKIFNGDNAGIIKIGNNIINFNKEPLLIMSLVLQLIWQINQLSDLGIIIKDLHIENVLAYYDLNYNSNEEKYYRYPHNNNKNFFVKVQPVFFKIIDYGLYSIDQPVALAKTTNVVRSSVTLSPQVGMGNYIEILNKRNNGIFDGPNNSSLFTFVRNANSLDEVIEYYINKVSTIQQDYIITNTPNIANIIPDHIGN